jgi:tryptophan 2,3-dioxygenase
MLLNWAERPCPAVFPYSAALTAIRRQGKHFINDRLLAAFDHARRALTRLPQDDAQTLGKFLDVVLDKHDGTYNYLSYTGLSLLEPERMTLDDTADIALARHVHDTTVCALIGDAMRFELECLAGEDSYLPAMRPDADLIERRMRFALRSLEPSLLRLGFGTVDDESSFARHADKVTRFCSRQALSLSPFVLDISMQPVYVVHDEHLFLRILQTLDATFVSVSGLLRCALRACNEQPARAVDYVSAGDGLLQEGLKHFLTLSTMQKDSFSTFREFTTGASAIQSVNYKIMESLCRNPDAERLDSLAYSSVPGLQQHLRGGRMSLDEKLVELRARGDVAASVVAALETAMAGLAETMTRWRHSHYGIAKKYLGDGTGTGYTEGTPYLKMVKDLPVFTALPTPPPSAPSPRRP